MKRGEKLVLALIALVVAVVATWNILNMKNQEPDKGIPFYSTASLDVQKHGFDIFRKYDCKSCHTLWTVRSLIENVPSPALDGIGSIRDEEWLYRYLSASNPQEILPSRLKREYQMPSFASMPEDKRRLLAGYLASLKVQDWYLEETRKAEYEKLTGKEYKK